MIFLCRAFREFLRMAVIFLFGRTVGSWTLLLIPFFLAPCRMKMMTYGLRMLSPWRRLIPFLFPTLLRANCWRPSKLLLFLNWGLVRTPILGRVLLILPFPWNPHTLWPKALIRTQKGIGNGYGGFTPSPKIHSFICLFCLERLKTLEFLSRLNIVDSDACPMCLGITESCVHLCRECSFFTIVWLTFFPHGNVSSCGAFFE